MFKTIYFYLKMDQVSRKNRMPIKSLVMRSLPVNVLHIIKEYSRPLTRPNWRQSKPIISIYQLYLKCRRNIEERFKLHCIIIDNIYKTKWYYMYMFINKEGIHRYCYYHNVSDSAIVNIDGIKEAVFLYNSNNLFYEYKCIY